jgi:hypothetical protein
VLLAGEFLGEKASSVEEEEEDSETRSTMDANA